MTVEGTFLQAIVANPEDDTSRLVYADWLEENGRPERAEFIRGQCRLARMQEWDEGYTELNARCKELLLQHREEWFGSLEGFTLFRPPTEYDYLHQVARGFLERVWMKPSEFAKRWEDVFSRTPILGLALEDQGKGPPDFWKCKGLARLQRLELYFGYRKAASRYSNAILSSPNWKLAHLGVPSDIVDNLPETLASAPYAPNLRRLEVVSRWGAPSAWRPLWRATSLTNLKCFSIYTRHSWDQQLDFAELTSARWFPRIERLRLCGVDHERPLAINGFEALLCGNLRALVTTGMRFSLDEVRAYKPQRPAQLEYLNLGTGDGLDRKTMRALIQSPALAGLRFFALNNMSYPILKYLVDAPMRQSLRVLEHRIWCCPGDVLQLARVGGCPELTRLAVGFARQPGDQRAILRAVESLLDPRFFPRLASLNSSHLTCERYAARL